MLFNEQSFLFLFLPIVFVGILLLRAGSPHLSSWWIIFSSFFFYGFHGWEHLPLLTFSILLNFGLGSAIQRKVGNRSAAHLLTFGIVCNLGVLAVFKYADFLTSSLGFEHSLNLSLPLAISFFTFQQIAYLVDVRKGKMTSPSFTHYAVFVSFFPQLIAGPIVRCQQIIPQLREGRLGKLSSQAFWIGLCLFSIGLFKKACMADGIRPLVEPIFESSSTGGTLSMVEAWLGATAFGLQIYFDFSAYSDMALGLGLLLGIRLPFNFDSPYKAVNVVDFWRRWHVTLSEFLRDYLYKPLG
ncbi:MAG: MBOAT family O-acyltransferase, partial [Verrucomicrobiota bacterium]|nr:MBOAT family O-acyltransferase [Verrucomicrobiota bacterium]